MDLFKHYDKVIVIAPPSTSPDDVSYLDGAVGIYLRKANDTESVVSFDDDDAKIYQTVSIENKYIKSYDDWSNRRKGEENMDEKHTETISEENHEKDREENFIPKLQELLGIADGVRFRINTDLFIRCYFENGELILTEKNSDREIEDDTLRNKVFYGLATGTIKPIVGKLATIPKDGFKYYFWQTVLDANREKGKFYPSIAADFWEGTLEDYMRFYVGNCFPTREACEKHQNVIEEIKNRALQTRMDKLIIGPGKIAIPFYGVIRHKTISLDKPVGVYVLDCGKDKYGDSKYFAVFDQEFREGSVDAPFSILEDLPSIRADCELSEHENLKLK